MRGQASSEFLMLFGGMLLVASVVLALAVVWPSYLYSVEKQRADGYWSSARPFSVRAHNMFPDQMVLELLNTEPVSLTVKEIRLDGIKLDFANHTVPFSWARDLRCSAGDCTMWMRPGQIQIISTSNFTNPPLNPCISEGSFIGGARYKLGLSITYHGSNSSDLQAQAANFKLIGTCSER